MGKVVGIIGAGQLGVYLCQAAKTMDLTTIAMSSSKGAPALQVADQSLIADYDDLNAINELAERCDVITYEFENIPQASLDALCRRFEIDLSRREKHGALLDAELLAEVYLQLRGGRQPDLALAGNEKKNDEGPAIVQRQARPARPHAPSADELAAHAALVENLNGPIWSAGDD